MSKSTEACVLEAVIEDNDHDAELMLTGRFLDGELIEFADQLGRTLDLVNEEARRRGLTRT
jgi:ATP:corrinoid adenosyltransferase